MGESIPGLVYTKPWPERTQVTGANSASWFSEAGVKSAQGRGGGGRQRQREKAGEVIKAEYERLLLRPFDVPQEERKVAETHRKSSRKK